MVRSVRLDGEGSDFVVVGAGIAGLTVAAALASLGARVLVCEQRTTLAPVGAGLTVQPNAVLALRRLGLADALDDTACVLDSVTITDAAGRVLSALGPHDADALRRAVGAPAWGLHRATLHHHLLAAAEAAGVRVRTHARVVSVDPHAASVTMADGSVETGGLLLGADGLHSRVRPAVLQAAAVSQPAIAETPVRYSGYTCWRGVTSDASFPPGWSGEFWGAGRRFGGCTIDGGRTYWFAVVSTPPGGGDRDGGKASVTRLVEGFARPVRETVAATPAEAIFRNDISDRAPIATWGVGPTTLLGDAAHPMTPNLGQGACQGIEDALVLRDQVATHGATPTALRMFETIRRGRANAVVTRAHQLGRIAQLHTPAAVMLRNTALRLTPSAVLSRQLRDGWTLPY